ncbi:hypothetical protein DDE82_003842 [Stemphylium lycopersici]|nr:hypothetical protein TW65_07357 [Stemphylium lycopersici]RAR05653.1 hypothetical protein DDE82_003842 [Stemphylium lycopersici]
MAGDLMQKPLSPKQLPKEFGNAAVQWACTRRGRMIVLTIMLLSVFLGLMGMRNQEALSSRYHNMSSYYPWRPHFPSFPDIIHSPLKTPSNTTLQLENGEIDHVPSNLKKTTPNFHLIMSAERDTHGFCKTTLSAMLLNYPPPTVAQFHSTYKSDVQWQEDNLKSTLHYLSNKKLVKDQDLVLIVDGQQSWFQLPSDVIVTQYKRLLEDANVRLFKRYGADKYGFQKFNQTIVFGAEKMCEDDDVACKYVPQSVFSEDLYATETGRRISEMPAKFINSKMVMGPASDLRTLYRAALLKFQKRRSQSQTVQSVFATLFAEQQLRRDAVEVEGKHASTRVKDFITGRSSKSAAEQRLERANAELSNTTRHEFSIGLDYTHTLFQPLIYGIEDELIPLVHDNSTDLSEYSHFGSSTQYLSLPSALNETKTPFWRPDFVKHNPSPNEKPAYIDKLELNLELDALPSRKVSWDQIPLIQNTYTGAVPAVILNSPSHFAGQNAPSAKINWDDLWYADYKRALLRNYFRTPQSPDGYHNSLVGGDRYWDTRGGRGGVWTEAEQIWLPWGEVDGVCGSLAQLKEVFADGRGVWLHELEENGEQGRLNAQEEFAKKVMEQREKDRERKELERLKTQRLGEEEKQKKINFETLKALDQQQAKEEDEEQEREKMEKLQETEGEEVSVLQKDTSEPGQTVQSRRKKKKRWDKDLELECVRYC